MQGFHWCEMYLANKVARSFQYVTQITEIYDQEFSAMHLHKSDQMGAVFIAKDVKDKFGVRFQ